VRRLALLPLVILLAGCPEKKQEAAPTGTAASSASAAPVASASAAPSASASAAPVASAAADAGARHDMSHCPTAVPDAIVAIKDVEGGVELTITGKNETAGMEIRDRMDKLAAAAKNAADAGVKHTGKGEGHGMYGRCTVVMKNTKLEVGNAPNGIKVTVKALDKGEVDWLRRETRDRDKEAKAPGGEGAGTQRMAHCPSAVEGAKTVVKDGKDAVVVTVTGPADKVAEIRDRAKHVAEVAKMPEAKKVEHTGKGTGGGGLGRCPIVVEGDTTVDVKDVEGGVEATVKSKKDFTALVKETKERAANFPAK